MRFSIIVPIYNIEEYLDECITSILGQKMTDFELILIDDGSTDSSGQICDKYAETDNRVTVIHKENSGASVSRNMGISHAKGEYIVFVDSDDSFKNDEVLDNFCKQIEKYNNPDILLNNTWGDYDINCHTSEELLTFLIKLGFREKKFDTVPWDKIYKKEYIDSNNFRFTEGYTHEDILWTFTTIVNADTYGIIDVPFYNRRVLETSISRNTSDNKVFFRAISKLNITKFGADYFNNETYGNIVKAYAYEFFMGIYMNGIAEGLKVQDKNLYSKFQQELRKTKDIFKIGKYTNNKKYKLISVTYSIFGVKPIITYLKRR